MSNEPLDPKPAILPLGDSGLLVRMADKVTDAANRAAIALARRIEAERVDGVGEVVPNLVSVLVRYDASRVRFDRLAGEIRLLASLPAPEQLAGTEHRVDVTFDGEDLGELAATLRMPADAFVAAHNLAPLRVLATGFAPGFIYCGMHDAELVVPRRATVRRQVAAGTVLFAAGQTAITSTAIPTGWHVIGHTAFRNFDPTNIPPSEVVAGDRIRFEVA